MRITCTLLALVTLAMAASASPVIWTLSGVTLSDGVAVNGSFTFNADTPTACTGGTTPCGTYSNVNITTTTGGGLTAATFLDVCGTDVPTCTGVSPDSTEVLFLTSNAADQTGSLAIAFFFTGVGGAPPAGLTDAGGIIDVSNSSGSVGAVNEAPCGNSACGSPSAPSYASTAGFVEAAVPEPSSAMLVGMSLAGLGLAGLRRIYRSRRAAAPSRAS
jgi:hypothetical protein